MKEYKLMTGRKRWMALLALFTLHCSLFISEVPAQDIRMVKGCCTPAFTDNSEAGARMFGIRRLPTINQHWDSEKVYRQLVILISFSDTDFKSETPQQTYNSMLNEEGYNERNGSGCLAEYFRHQSGGLFNVQFDVFGPYKTSGKAQPFENPSESSRNYGREPMTAATKMFLEEHPDMDFSPYDWNGDGYVNQVIYVYAGFCGNQASELCYGCIWPNTSSFTTITTPDGKKITDYSASGELWVNKSSCGIGTICHEFTHSLGLPDIYPTSNNGAYSVVDEWDLMDGGNFTNYGWCPPNYTPLEKMLLGWLTPTELNEPKTIRNLATVDDGGEVFIVKNTDSEYYLLENRQWKGWDAGIPGKGLVIYHVNYDASTWRANTVNNNKNAPKFHLICADNKDYDAWDTFLEDSATQYANKPRMNNLHLSGAPYPFVTSNDSVVNALTDSSEPAAAVYHANAEGTLFMSKPITDIVQHEDGTVSFLFMGGDTIPNAICDYTTLPAKATSAVYNMLGRRATVGAKGLLLQKRADGTTRKIIR